MTARKSTESVKEHVADTKRCKLSTSLSRLNQCIDINIVFIKDKITAHLSHYNI